MRVCVVLCALVAAAAPASAQSTYVGASLVGDIARFNSVEYDDEGGRRRGPGQRTADDVALGFNLTIGRGLGERWGVELEWARSGVFERTDGVAVPALFPESVDPRYGFEYESEVRHTSLAVLGWVRQDLGRRVELAYLAGVSFNQVRSQHDYDGPVIQIFPPVVIPGFETTSYGVGPIVGVEAAVRVGVAAVTTGVRLQSVEGAGGTGWLIRPNVGLRWRF